MIRGFVWNGNGVITCKKEKGTTKSRVSVTHLN